MSLDWSWVSRNLSEIGGLAGVHLLLSLVPVAVGLVLAVAIGSLLHRAGPLARGPLLFLGLIASVPGLALLVLVVVLLGVRPGRPLSLVLALTVYAFARLTCGVVAGLRGVPAAVQESAAALGYGRLARLVRIELPLALPRIFASLRGVTVAAIALVALAVLLGQRSLGSLIDRGYTQHILTPVLVGLVLCLALAGLADALILTLQRGTLRWRRARRLTA